MTFLDHTPIVGLVVDSIISIDSSLNTSNTVTGGGVGLLRCGRSERKTREQRGGRGKERHGLLAQTSKRC